MPSLRCQETRLARRPSVVNLDVAVSHGPRPRVVGSPRLLLAVRCGRRDLEISFEPDEARSIRRRAGTLTVVDNAEPDVMADLRP